MSTIKTWTVRVISVILLFAAVISATFIETHSLQWYVRLSIAVLFANGLLTAGGLLHSTYRPEQLRTPRGTFLSKILWTVLAIALVALVVIYLRR